MGFLMCSPYWTIKATSSAHIIYPYKPANLVTRRQWRESKCFAFWVYLISIWHFYFLNCALNTHRYTFR